MIFWKIFKIFRISGISSFGARTPGPNPGSRTPSSCRGAERWRSETTVSKVPETGQKPGRKDSFPAFQWPVSVIFPGIYRKKKSIFFLRAARYPAARFFYSFFQSFSWYFRKGSVPWNIRCRPVKAGTLLRSFSGERRRIRGSEWVSVARELR